MINDEEGTTLTSSYIEKPHHAREYDSQGREDQVAAAKSKWQTLIATVPKGERVRMQLICSSLDARPWYRPIVYEHPQLPLSALKSQSVIWFPKSCWATPGWPTIAGDWQDRFCPRQWWRLLSFQPGSISPEATSRANDDQRTTSFQSSSGPVTELLLATDGGN